jgi:hypothetical protein
MQGFKENMECAFIPKADQPKYYDLQQFLGENLGRAFYGEMTGTEAVVDAAKKGEEFLANP